MSSADFHIKQNDTAPSIESVLEDGSGNAIDLTGASVRFMMKHPSKDTAKVDSSATITDATNGKVRYSWSSSDTDMEGRFHAEWEVEHSDGTVESFPNSDYLEIRILDDIA